MYPSASPTHLFSIIMFKKKNTSTQPCHVFVSRKKLYNPPGGVVTFKGATSVFPKHGLLSYRLLRWSNPTLCQSSGGCQAPGALQGQGARLHGLRIPMSGWSEKLMGWWGDGILGLPLTKTNSNVHTGIIHMIKIYIYIYYIYDMYIYTFSCVCTYKDWDIYLNLFIHSDLYMDQSVRSLALRFHATCIELSYLWLGGDSCHPR